MLASRGCSSASFGTMGTGMGARSFPATLNSAHSFTRTLRSSAVNVIHPLNGRGNTSPGSSLAARKALTPFNTAWSRLLNSMPLCEPSRKSFVVPDFMLHNRAHEDGAKGGTLLSSGEPGGSRRQQERHEFIVGRLRCDTNGNTRETRIETAKVVLIKAGRSARIRFFYPHRIQVRMVRRIPRQVSGQTL